MENDVSESTMAINGVLFLAIAVSAWAGYRVGKRTSAPPETPYALLNCRVGSFPDNYFTIFSSRDTDEAFRGRITVSLWESGFWRGCIKPVVSFTIQATKKEAKKRLIFELNKVGIYFGSNEWRRSFWEFDKATEKSRWVHRSLGQLPYGESVFRIEVEGSREAEEIAAVLEADSALRVKVLHLLRGEK